jgi:hypothetical protein
MVADLQLGAMNGKILNLKDYIHFVETALQNNQDDEIYQSKGKELLRHLRSELDWQKSLLRNHKNFVKQSGIKF